MTSGAVTEQAVADVPPMPVRTFKNPVADKFFRRRSRRVKEVEVTVEDDAGVPETFTFLVHEMSSGMRARFEGIMAENARKAAEEAEAETLDGSDPSNEGSEDLEDLDALEENATRGFDMGNFKIAVVAASVTDMDGNPLFDEDEIDMVGDVPSPLIEPLFEAAMLLSELGKPKKREINAEKK